LILENNNNMAKTKLEKMMKKDGWVLGYYTNYGVKYWSFRKEGFEIPLRELTKVCFEKNSKHFESWKENKNERL